MPGYGWVFGMGDGTANVGFGLLDTRRGERRRPPRGPAPWLATFPAEDQLDEEHAVTPLRGAGLPWRCTAAPRYSRGLLLAGDAAGTVNPFNGEGISYAMETGRMAAETAVDALAAPTGPRRESALRRYPAGCARRTAGTTGSAWVFLALLSRPDVVRFATAHGLKRPALVHAALRLWAI